MLTCLKGTVRSLRVLCSSHSDSSISGFWTLQSWNQSDAVHKSSDARRSIQTLKTWTFRTIKIGRITMQVPYYKTPSHGLKSRNNYLLKTLSLSSPTIPNMVSSSIMINHLSSFNVCFATPDSWWDQAGFTSPLFKRGVWENQNLCANAGGVDFASWFRLSFALITPGHLATWRNKKIYGDLRYSFPQVQWD